VLDIFKQRVLGLSVNERIFPANPVPTVASFAATDAKYYRVIKDV